MHSEREVGFEYSPWPGSLRWVNSYGAVLTPMKPVGRNSFTASTKVATGARSWANGVWKAVRAAKLGSRPRAGGLFNGPNCA